MRKRGRRETPHKAPFGSEPQGRRPSGFSRLPHAPTTRFHFPSPSSKKNRAASSREWGPPDTPRLLSQRSDRFPLLDGLRGSGKSGGGEKTLGALWVVSPPPVCISKTTKLVPGKPRLCTPDACVSSRRSAFHVEKTYLEFSYPARRARRASAAAKHRVAVEFRHASAGHRRSAF
jgi:hypothetical protein